MLSLNVISNINAITTEIDYSVVPDEWVDLVKNIFMYPPTTVPSKLVVKLIKANAKPQKTWPTFSIRKIHHRNISK